MAKMQVYGTVLSKEGRVVVPAALRKTLHLRTGENMVWVCDGDQLVLKPRRAVEQELWSLFTTVKESLAAELMKDRRRQAKDEA